MNESSPPLKVWVYTLALVVLLLLFSTYALKTSPNIEKAELAKMQAPIKKALRTNYKSNTSILFLGSSLTGHALYNLTAIEDRFKIKNKDATRVFRIAINGLDYQLLEDLHIFDCLIESPPDYLFIESNHINIDDKDSKQRSNLLNSSVNNLMSFAKKTIGLPENKSIHFFKDTQNSRLHQDNFDTTVYAQLLKKKRLVRTFTQNKKVNDAFVALIKRKTKIVFLDFPRAPKLEEIWLDGNQKKELQTLLKTYHQKYGITYWKYPYRLSNSDFTDGGHLNYKGAKKYQEWLAAQFKLLR